MLGMSIEQTKQGFTGHSLFPHNNFLTNTQILKVPEPLSWIGIRVIIGNYYAVHFKIFYFEKLGVLLIREGFPQK